MLLLDLEELITVFDFVFPGRSLTVKRLDKTEVSFIEQKVTEYVKCIIIYVKIKAMVNVAKCIYCKFRISHHIEGNSKEQKGKYNVPLYNGNELIHDQMKFLYNNLLRGLG